MRKGGLFTRDWFAALIITLLFAAASFSHQPILENLENLAYDYGVRMTYRQPGATERIAIVAIDDASIERIGRWPWPRSVLADMLERLSKARAKIVDIQILLTESQTDQGLLYIRKLKS